MNYWLAVGSRKNWEDAFRNGNIWGLSHRQKKLWSEMEEGDVVLFYVTRPVAGVIGYGNVKTKFKQDKPLWSEEINKGKAIWKLRFEFDISYCLPEDKWEFEKATSEILRFKAGVNFRRLEKALAEELISKFERAKGTEAEEPLHEEMKQKLIQIGKLQNYIAEEEYKFDLGRLDVVWRRVKQSVPTYVFEINVRGDIYRALSKLKHAYDLWNSRIFIVADKFEEERVKNLLSGSFHEISNSLKFIDFDTLNELYELKIKLKNLEQKLGL
jgi:predicted RNA-binding protein